MTTSPTRRGKKQTVAPASSPATWRAGGKIWLGEQETSYSCGPASLKYALCVLGFSPREAQLRALARTTWQGTQTTKLLQAARRFGLQPELRVFFETGARPTKKQAMTATATASAGFAAAWTWLKGEVAAGRPVILDVEGFAHYVVAVQDLDGDVVVIDPEGETMNGSGYADVVVCSPKKLKPWWLSGDEDGEPDAFRGISLTPTRTSDRPRLRFSAAALRRYRLGRPWVLDEYLVDVVDIAGGCAGCTGDAVALGDVVRALEDAATRMAFWHESTAAEVQMARAHLEDIAVAADSMALMVPGGEVARQRVAVDVAALLTAMLWSPG